MADIPKEYAGIPIKAGGVIIAREGDFVLPIKPGNPPGPEPPPPPPGGDPPPRPPVDPDEEDPPSPEHKPETPWEPPPSDEPPGDGPSGDEDKDEGKEDGEDKDDDDETEDKDGEDKDGQDEIEKLARDLEDQLGAGLAKEIRDRMGRQAKIPTLAELRTRIKGEGLIAPTWIPE